MKQYEISNNGKFVGTINVQEYNIKETIKNTIIETSTNKSYKFNNTNQTYKLTFLVNNID